MIIIAEKFLGFVAKSLITRFNPVIIGVTGSSGKTTTKYMIGEMLSQVISGVRSTRENLNTEIGLPLAVLGFEKSPKGLLAWLWAMVVGFFRFFFTYSYPKILVLEYAADKPGDIEYLVEIVPPDIAVVTNIGVAHLGAFKSRENIAREKWILARTAKQAVFTTDKVINDTKNLLPAKGEVIVVGKNGPVLEKIVKEIKITKVQFSYNKKKIDVSLKFHGLHNIENFLLSFGVCSYLTGDTQKVAKAAENIEPLPGRGKRFIARNKAVIIDESYNANPLSMKAAIDNLSEVHSKRRLAILGEMKELGDITANSHKEIAKYARVHTDFIVGVGNDFSNLDFDLWFSDVDKLIKEIDNIVEPEDVVLVKGSRSNNLDKLVDRLE